MKSAMCSVLSGAAAYGIAAKCDSARWLGPPYTTAPCPDNTSTRSSSLNMSGRG